MVVRTTIGRRLFAYLPLTPDDDDEAEVALRKRLEDYTEAHLPNRRILWLADRLDGKLSTTPLRKRPEGRRLYEEPRAGDVVLFADIARSASRVPELRRFLQYHANNCLATICFADLEPTEDISVLDMGKLVATCLAFGQTIRYGERPSRKGCPNKKTGRSRRRNA